MRRSILIVASAALVVGGTAAATAAPETTAKPSLRLAGTEPIKLRGASFKPSEVVRVTLATGGAQTVRRVRASRLGSFTATFGETQAFDPCNADARAVGSRGSVATLKLPQRMCLIARAP